MQLQRHDLVDFTSAYRTQIAKYAIEGLLPCCRETQVQEKVGLFLQQNSVPGIVCRPVKEIAADEVQLGLSFPFRNQGVRVRSSIVVDRRQIEKVTRPFALVGKQGLGSNALQDMLDRIVMLARAQGLKVGLIGSAALEIFTGHAYTSVSSDLDLVVSAAPHDVLRQFYLTISTLSKQNARAVDVEVILGNGNGVKLGELASESRSILAKSLTDVCLLNRDSVLKALVA